LKKELRASTEQINQILDSANKEIKEIEKASYFSYRIINDDLESGYEDFRNAILAIFPFLKSGFEENMQPANDSNNSF
jgi:guanylate kinase